MELNSNTLDKFHENFLAHPEFQVSKNAIGNSGFKRVVISRNYIQRDTKDLFSKKIDVSVKPTDQEESGRCWMFAMLNVIRLDMIKKMDLDNDFEFSQNYLFFYFKLEQANYFLKLIREYRAEDIDSRMNYALFENPVEDGGHFQMFADLVNKYGLVPKSVMGDSVQAKNTSSLNTLLKTLLREAAVKIRDARAPGVIDKLIEDALKKVYNILVIFLGEPPKTFDWEYYKQSRGSKRVKSKSNNGKKKNGKSVKKKKSITPDRYSKKKDKKRGGGDSGYYRIVRDLTPQLFLKKFVPFNADDYIVLIDYPNRERFRRYNVDYSKTMVDGSETNYINVPINYIKAITKLSIDLGSAVWFGCDVGKYSSNFLGIMDKDMFKYKEVVGFDLETEKDKTLDSSITELSHAMVIKGYTSRDKKVVNWMVENSWGDSTGKNGNYKMADSWFDDYVMMAAFKKKYLPKKILKVLKTKPLTLPAWCPFGGLMQ